MLFPGTTGIRTTSWGASEPSFVSLEIYNPMGFFGIYYNSCSPKKKLYSQRALVSPKNIAELVWNH
jgi:hypothetical protein